MPTESSILSKNIAHSFLQSSEWERFNQSMGSKTWRVEGALVVKISARRGVFLLIPHIDTFSVSLRDKLIELGKSEDCAFIRVCPLIKDTADARKVFFDMGFRPAPIYMHPEFAWILNIHKTDDELLSQMRKTT